IHFHQGNLRKAQEASLKVLEILEKLHDKTLKPYSLNNMGVILKELGDFPKSLEYFQKALKMAQEKGDLTLIPSVLNNIGSLLEEEGNFQEALEFFRKSLNMKLSLSNPSGMAGTLNNIGFLYYLRADYIKALEYYTHALKMEEEFGSHQGRALTLNNLSALLIECGRYEEALEYLQEVFRICKETEILIQESYGYRLLGFIAAHQGKLTEGISYLKKSLQLAKEGNYLSQIGLTYLGLMDLHLERKEFEEAEKWNQQFLSLGKAISKVMELKHVFLQAKEQYLKGSSEIFQTIARGKELLGLIHLPELVWRLHMLEGKALEKEEQWEESYSAYKAAFEELEKLSQRIPSHFRKTYLGRKDCREVRNGLLRLGQKVDLSEKDFFSLVQDKESSTRETEEFARLHLHLEKRGLIWKEMERILKEHGFNKGILLERNKGNWILKSLWKWKEEEAFDFLEELDLDQVCQRKGRIFLLSSPGDEVYSYLVPFSWHKEGLSTERVSPLEVRGVFLFQRSHPLKGEERDFLEIFSLHAYLALKSNSLYFEATCDPLTGLLQGKEFLERLEKESKEILARGEFYSLAVLELFPKEKKANSGFWLAKKGKEILVKVAQALEESFPLDSLIVRYRESIFVLYLPQIGRDETLRLIQKLEDRITRILDRASFLGAAIGISRFPFHGKKGREIFLKAEQALNSAKEKNLFFKEWDEEDKEIPTELLNKNLPWVALRVLEVLRELQKEKNPKEGLTTIMDSLLEITQYERAFLWGPSPEGGIIPFWGRDQKGKTIPPLEISMTIPLEVFESGEVYHSYHTSLSSSKRTFSMDRFSLTSVLAFPLLWKGEAFGVLYLDTTWKTKDILTENIPIFTLLANQAALFLYDLIQDSQKLPSPSQLAQILAEDSTLDQMTKLLYRCAKELDFDPEDWEDLLFGLVHYYKRDQFPLPSHSPGAEIAKELANPSSLLSEGVQLLKGIIEWVEHGKILEDLPFSIQDLLKKTNIPPSF
ncbi:MAG: diguanylate cyclase, partial [Planctomycetota bacterium]